MSADTDNTLNMNSAYVEYAEAHGRTPDEMVAHDHARGVHYREYIAWRLNPNRPSGPSLELELMGLAKKRYE
jgi:hypothetical protein